MVFHWGLGDRKSPQVTRTLLSILPVLNNAVIWMVSTRPPNSKSSSPFNSPSFTALNAPIMINKIVTFLSHIFFNSLARSTDQSIFFYFPSVIFCGQLVHQIRQFLKFSFSLITIRYGLLAEIRWSVCMSKSHIFYVCHSLRKLLGCVHTICSYVQISNSCTSPSGSPFPASRV